MKFPIDIRGGELARLLNKFDYKITRQTGSHLRLTRISEEEHHIPSQNTRVSRSGL